MNKEVILTGLRSNAEFHLGNYLGAILPMVELQKKYAGTHQLNMFVPDLHSFTTPVDHNALYEQSLKNLEVFVAAGLDINNPYTYIYRQSYIPAHSEMTWILSCFTYYGELERMTQFKEKSRKYNRSDVLLEQIKKLKTESENEETIRLEIIRLFQELTDMRNSSTDEEQKKRLVIIVELAKSLIHASTTATLFIYPSLMAADILLYGAKWVPVGEDQRQHLELTRDLAIRMNNKFGELFTVPNEWQKQLEFTGLDKGVRIRSLRNPEKKMSKSIDDPAGTIMLSDNPDDAAAKVMGATTDSEGVIQYDFDKQPGISNLLQILSLLQQNKLESVSQQWEGKNNYGELKSATAEAVKSFLIDFQAKLSAVDRDAVLQKLKHDEDSMAKVANAKLLDVQIAVGLRPKP